MKYEVYADVTLSATKSKTSATQFKRKKETDFKVELFEYQERQIFEIRWLSKTHRHYNTASIEPTTAILKWNLQFKFSFWNFVLRSTLKWSSSKNISFSKRAMQIEWTSVTLRSWFLHMRKCPFHTRVRKSAVISNPLSPRNFQKFAFVSWCCCVEKFVKAAWRGNMLNEMEWATMLLLDCRTNRHTRTFKYSRTQDEKPKNELGSTVFGYRFTNWWKDFRNSG